MMPPSLANPPIHQIPSSLQSGSILVSGAGNEDAGLPAAEVIAPDLAAGRVGGAQGGTRMSPLAACCCQAPRSGCAPPVFPGLTHGRRRCAVQSVVHVVDSVLIPPVELLAAALASTAPNATAVANDTMTANGTSNGTIDAVDMGMAPSVEAAQGQPAAPPAASAASAAGVGALMTVAAAMTLLIAA